MKLIVEERVKHRLIGLAVILSIAAIFAPAIVKKSNQRLENNMKISVRLPSKPMPPQVVVPNEQAMFNQAKLAKIEMPAMPDEHIVMKVAKAEQLSLTDEVKLSSNIAELKINLPHSSSAQKVAVRSEPIAKKSIVPDIKKQAKQEKANLVTNKIKKSVLPVAKQVKPSNRYVVQLATFAQKQNAELLVNKLQQKGFKATYNKINMAEGVLYRVLVGEANRKEQAHILQKQLVSIMQLKGFVVETEAA